MLQVWTATFWQNDTHCEVILSPDLWANLEGEGSKYVGLQESKQTKQTFMAKVKPLGRWIK